MSNNKHNSVKNHISNTGAQLSSPMKKGQNIKNTLDNGSTSEMNEEQFEQFVKTLDASSPEIIENQATINVGTLGHVSHGKSTLVEGISGIKPIKFDAEKARNITIKLGYANFKIYQCPTCPKPGCFKSWKSTEKKAPSCTLCKGPMKLIRHFSFVDCPGHDCLMQTMLNGAAAMDSALLVVAANAKCPQAQTTEHLVAAEIMGLKDIIVVQTKVDLVTEQELYQNYEQLLDFAEGTIAEKKPVIPLSCTPFHQYNLDVLLQYLCEKIPVPKRDFTAPPLLQVIRSFDINHPGGDLETLKGGVAGGTLIRGVLKVGQLVEVRPGLIKKGPNGLQCYPIVTQVKSLFSEKTPLQFAVPGGLIGIGTTLDPTLTKADRLVGQVIGAVGKLPDVFLNLEIQVNLLKRQVGLKDEEATSATNAAIKVKPLEKDENLQLNIGSTTAIAKVVSISKPKTKKDPTIANITLSKPCCAEPGEMVSLSRNMNGSWRLIGYAVIKQGVPLPLNPITMK